MNRYQPRGTIKDMSGMSGRVIEEDDSYTHILDFLRGGIIGGQPTAQAIDGAGRRADISMGGEVMSGRKYDDISVNLHYGVSPRDATATTTGTGSVGQENSLATLSCGAGVGSAVLSSRRSVRYKAGHEVYGLCSVVMGAPENGVEQSIGFWDGVDGLMLGYQGIQPGIFLYMKGDKTFVPQAQWNIDTLDGTGRSGYAANFRAGQVCSFKYVWHGLREMWVEILTAAGRMLPVHQFSFVNVETDTHFLSPALPISARVERTAGTGESVTLKTGSWRAGTVIGDSIAPASRRYDYSVIDKSLSGGAGIQVMLGLRSDTIHRGVTNSVPTEIIWNQFVTDGSKAVLFETWLPSQGTLSAPLVYQHRDPVSSVMSFSDTSSTFTPSQGELSSSSVVVEKSGSVIVTSPEGTGIVIYPGQELYMTARSSGGSNVSLSIQTLEYF